MDESEGLLVRDFHFRKTTGGRSVHRRDNSVNMPVHRRPLGIAKYHDGYPAVFEVLLVSDVFVCR